ncbi:MAG: hypothetical protein ACR9NN_15390 [Nostochopsis sp.]
MLKTPDKQQRSAVAIFVLPFGNAKGEQAFVESQSYTPTIYAGLFHSHPARQ